MSGNVQYIIYAFEVAIAAAMARFVWQAIKSTPASVAFATVWLALPVGFLLKARDGGGAGVLWYWALTPVFITMATQLLRRRPRKTKPECNQLEVALKDSDRVIAAYQAFLDGRASYEEVTKNLKEMGNAWQGVSGVGKDKPKIIQEAIAEVEAFDFGEEGRQVLALLWAVMQPGDTAALRKKAEIEIERQEHFNAVVRRKKKENGC